MADGDKPNDGADLLAKAMRQVFKETVQDGVQPVKGAADSLKAETTKDTLKRLENGRL